MNGYKQFNASCKKFKRISLTSDILSSPCTNQFYQRILQEEHK